MSLLRAFRTPLIAATLRAPVPVRRVEPIVYARFQSSLAQADIESRVLDVIKSFEKVDPKKVSLA